MGDVLAVIPARYGSSRFPGKPLALIAGVPMIVRVLRQVQQSTNVDRVLVATDDDRIAMVVRDAGGEAALTDPDLPSGTDRVWAASKDAAEEIVINVQGDEPLLPPAVLDRLVEAIYLNERADIATPVVSVTRERALHPDAVTVAATAEGRVLYFSRSTIPYNADPVLQHIGVYAYRRSALARFVGQSPSPLETRERLEQLRALEAGMFIVAVPVEAQMIAVDRPADVARVEAVLRGEPTAVDLTAIRLVALDVDGVLTDGRVTYDEGDRQAMSFDIKDGYGIVALLQAGVQVAMISGRDSAALRRRAAELGVTHVAGGVSDKNEYLHTLAAELSVPLSAVCFIGDDIPDLPAMQACGFSGAPADATATVVDAARIRLSRPGGCGAVRELADLILQVHRT